jgi:protein-tyrosine phosphatase
MATEADLVLTATRAIRSQVVATAPAALKRTFTLLELAALLEAPPWGDSETDVAQMLARAADWRASVSGLGNDLDVPDPIGRSPQVHRTAADLADRATRVIAAWLG